MARKWLKPIKEVILILFERSAMKKHFNKTARHGHAYRVGLGIYSLDQGYYGSPDYSPCYA